MSDDRNNYRFETGPIVSFMVALVVAATIGLLIYALVKGHFAGVIALGLLLAGSTITGLILERIDRSRRREQGTRPGLDDYWGFRGRPGS